MEKAKKIQCMGCMEFYDAGMDKCPFCGRKEDLEPNHVLHIVPGTLLKKRYVIGRALGYGSFGVTYIGWDRLMKRKVAIKEYLPSEFATRMVKHTEIILPEESKKREHFEKGMHRFRSEAEKLAKLGEVEGVVYVYDTFEENNTAYIIMEYLQGETLEALLEREGVLTESQTTELMLPLLQSLDEVHQHDIIHRDISPDNIFVCEDQDGKRKLKLIDFGAARFASGSHSKSLTVLLRPGYSPEEQYHSDGNLGPHTDVYSVAAVMYQMVTGQRPPDALERRVAVENHKRDLLKDPDELNSNLSDNFATSVLNAMNVRVEDRTPNVEEFLAELISFEKVKRRGSTIRRIDFFKWPLWAKIAVPAGGAAAVAVVIGLTMWLSGLTSGTEDFVLMDGKTFVPDFYTATEEQAQKLAEENHLLLSVSSEFFPDGEPGEVLEQDVYAGMMVSVNETIAVVISENAETFLMPDVTGMSSEDAYAALSAMDLNVETENGNQSGLAENCVIAQGTEAYTEVQSGDTVTLIVNTTETVTGGAIPNLVGMSYNDALEAAAEAGISLQVTGRTFTDDSTANTILVQSAESGTAAADVLQVTVSAASREFTMPNLVRKTQEKALQLLKNIGIEPEITEANSELIAVGSVTDQSIETGETVKPGDSIVVTISKGGSPTTVPNVTGLSQADAVKALQAAKLKYIVNEKVDADADEGTVLAQNIAAGTESPRGTEITIDVCTKTGVVTVENYVGMTTDAATAAVTAQGMKVETKETYSDAYASGQVIEQNPAAGTTRVAADTTVTLMISKGSDPSKTTSTSGTSGNGDTSGYTGSGGSSGYSGSGDSSGYTGSGGSSDNGNTGGSTGSWDTGGSTQDTGGSSQDTGGSYDASDSGTSVGDSSTNWW